MTEIAVNKNTNKNSTFSNLKPKIANALNSVWMMVVISLLIAGCWGINFPYVSIGFLVLYEIAVFVFCPENPKATLLPLLSVSYMINSIFGVFNWIYYGTCIGIFIITVVTYVLLQKFKYKKTFVKGKMFWFFVLSALGNCLAGIIGHFGWLEFIITVALSIIVYGIYWFCLNFIKDYKKYLAQCFIFLAVIITLQLVIAYVKIGDFAYAIQNKVVRVGTGEINTAAIFMLSGLCACFYLALKNKFDYLFVLLAIVFDIAIYFTFSRIALLLAGIISLVYFFVVFRYSSNKKLFLICLAIAIVALTTLVIVFYDKVVNFLSYYINLGFKPNGRKSLWTWCWEQFKSSPIFGIGYITRDPQALAGAYPGLTDLGGFSLVNCHNFFLHYLTCTGIVGFVLNIPLYVKKYMMTFKNFNHFKFFALVNFIAIFVSALFDSSPNMSIFNITPVLLLFACIEQDNNQIDLEKEKSNKPEFEKLNKKVTKQEETQTTQEEPAVKETKEKEPKPKKSKDKKNKDSKDLKEDKTEVKVEEPKEQKEEKPKKSSTKNQSSKNTTTNEEKETKPKTKKATGTRKTSKPSSTPAKPKVDETPKAKSSNVNYDDDTEAKKLTRKIIELSRRNNRNY